MEKEFKTKYPELYKRLLELAEKHEELTNEENIEVLKLMTQLLADTEREQGPTKKE